jgi:hypothetical protein
MPLSLSKPDDASIFPFSSVLWPFFATLVIAAEIIVGITYVTISAQDKNLGEYADTITFAEKIATLPKCAMAFGMYERTGTCTDDIHGIRVMKSERGIDFIDANKGGNWEVIASVDNYQVNGRLVRRIWESEPGSFKRVEKAFGKAAR